MSHRRCVVFLMLCFGPSEWAAADDFRVTTKVESASHETLLQTTTLFLGSRAYDFEQASPGAGEVMIVDLDSRSLTLLSPRSRQKTTVDFAVLDRLSDVVSTKARSSQHQPIVRFAAQPEFKRQWDPANQKLELKSNLLTYSTKLLKSPDASAASSYREFADVSARLATLPRGIPPQARLELNAAIAELGQLPVEVAKDLNGTAYTSHHLYSWKLNEEDLEALAEIDEWVSESETIGFGDYLGQNRQ